MRKYNEPIIDMHDTWLVVNSIQGCTNGCKYCFLQATNSNCEVPNVLVSPSKAIDELLSFKYYDGGIPVCLLPGTDAFLNKSNIDYVLELLDVIDKRNLSNPLVLITKCLVPKVVIDKVRFLISGGKKIVFYLSYSGLPQEFEPNVSVDNIRSNFKNLFEAGIPIIHYYRPFLKVNSSEKKIREVMEFVHQYTNYSVVAGLKVRENFIDKLVDLNVCLPSRDECLNSACVWPEEAYKFFFDGYDYPHFVFQTNYCALSSVLGTASAYYGSFECLNYNHCSDLMRARCKSFKVDNVIKRVKEKLVGLGYSESDFFVKQEDDNLILISDVLSISDVAFLTRVLGFKVSLFKKSDFDIHFNSSLSNTKPVIY